MNRTELDRPLSEDRMRTLPRAIGFTSYAILISQIRNFFYTCALLEVPQARQN